MIISSIIGDLLFEHNCVIIPNLGGFVGNYKSAAIEDLTHKISPPTKKISFNINLKTNDGLLISTVSKVKGISYQDAESLVNAEITTLKKTLQQGQPVYFNKVGKLYEDAHKILCFEPDSQYNLLKDSFGLSPIFAQIISKPNTQETAVNISPIKEKESIVPPNKPKATIPVLKIAATMLLLMGLGYVFWLLTSTEINNSNRAFQWADLNPLADKKCMKYVPKLIPDIGLKHFKDSNFENLSIPDSVSYMTFNIFLDEEKVENKKPKIVQLVKYQILKPASLEVKTLNPDKSNFNYYVVIGCFGVKENAEKLVAKLRSKGYDSGIIDNWKGLYRVHVARFVYKEDALDALEVIKQKENAGAWVLNK